MAPKKKKGEEEEAVPLPEELLPPGFHVSCEVFWVEYAQDIGGEDASYIVRRGSKGELIAVPDMITFEKEDGGKGYSLETVEVQFSGDMVPRTVVLKALALEPPPVHLMWNTNPGLQRKFVKVSMMAAPTLSKNSSRKAIRTPAPEQSGTQCASSPFVDAILRLEAYPRRIDRVESQIEPALVEFLNSEELHDSVHNFGSHHKGGWIDFQAIYPWVEQLVKSANTQANLSPGLSIDAESYSVQVKKFDGRGQFMNQCPRSEDILPFGKFVVTILYLESREEIRKRLGREREMRELLEREGDVDGCDTVASAVWDTEEDLEFWVGNPNSGVATQNYHFRAVLGKPIQDIDAGLSADPEEGVQTVERPIQTICWPRFDPQATGEGALPPLRDGDYYARLQPPIDYARQSAAPCHWALRVVAEGQSQITCGTWCVGDSKLSATIPFDLGASAPFQNAPAVQQG